jgi:hypothetical protein
VIWEVLFIFFPGRELKYEHTSNTFLQAVVVSTCVGAGCCSHLLAAHVRKSSSVSLIMFGALWVCV